MVTLNPEQIIRTAAGLAARGEYAAAEALLNQLGESQLTAEIWRLRAKIAAQQKQFDRAISLWQKILEKEPEDSETQDAIRLAEKMRDSRSPEILLRSRLYGVMAAAVALVLLVAVTAVAWRGPDDGDNSDLSALLARQQEQLQLNHDAIAALNDRQEQFAQMLSAKLGLLQAAVGTPDSQAQMDIQPLSEAVESVVASSRQLAEQVRQNTDALAAGVETLTATTQTLDKRVRENDEQLLQHVKALGQSTQQSQAQLSARIAAVGEAMSELTARTSDMGTQLQSDRVAWDQKTESLVQAIAQLEARTLEGKEALAGDMQRLEAQQQSDRTAWDRKVESLVQAVAQVDARTVEGKETLAGEIQRLEAQLQSERAAWDRKAESLRQAMAQLDARTLEGEQSLAKRIETAMTLAREQHDTLAGELAALGALQEDQTASLTEDVEGLRQEQRTRLSMVRAELGRALTLTAQMREVAASYRQLEKKFLWRGKAERQEALEKLSRLETAVDLLNREMQKDGE